MLKGLVGVFAYQPLVVHISKKCLEIWKTLQTLGCGCPHACSSVKKTSLPGHLSQPGAYHFRKWLECFLRLARFPGGKLTNYQQPSPDESRAELGVLHSGVCERASVRALMVHVPVLAASASQSLGIPCTSPGFFLPGLSILGPRLRKHPSRSGELGGLVWQQAVGKKVSPMSYQD